ncbi:MAG: hypothetical protein MUQ27_05835 [Acidimicrobiia bacterium]|nr:hypothetical protein [Acidimicrobiia bacterium]
MKRLTNAPILISGLFATAQILWSMRLAIDPDPFAVGAAVLVISGIVLYTVIAVVGILLVRAPWARWLALYATLVTLVVGTLGGVSPFLSIVATAMSLSAVGGLTGPWLRIWLRQRPGAGIDPAAVALPLLAIAALPLAGLASPEGLTVPAVASAVLGPVLAWAYARAFSWSLWALRIVVPPLAIIAAFAAGGWGAVAFIVFGVAVSALAWSPGARDALSPVQAPLPPPRVGPETRRQP